MNVNTINQVLSTGRIDERGVFPHLDRLKNVPYVFDLDFGLKELPEEPGVMLVRGARQYGKSTWMEGAIKQTIRSFGPGSAFYLNGDFISDENALTQAIQETSALFPAETGVRRLFIDEITAVKNWQKALKRTLDAGELDNVLVVTTGSRATDLMRGTERLPGRKGRLARTNFIFTPISYFEFSRVCGSILKEDTLSAYCLAGGCPVACAEIAKTGSLPAFIIEMIRDWIFGEFAADGRSRGSLIHVLECIAQRGGTPFGQYKLTKEAGLANNTVAAEYIRILTELLCVGRGFFWDPGTGVAVPRKPEKYHFINVLAASVFHPLSPRTPGEFKAMPSQVLGQWYEWVVAQELWRRAAITGKDMPEMLPFWQSKEHEVDFVNDSTMFIEVKYGQSSPVEFAWFTHAFPGKRLLVIHNGHFDAKDVKGITLEEFLAEGN